MFQKDQFYFLIKPRCAYDIKIHILPVLTGLVRFKDYCVTKHKCKKDIYTTGFN